jgi:hypothetical protein
MSYVIVNTGTEKAYVKPGNYSAAVYTEKGAKIVCSKLNKQYGNTGQWQIMTTDAFFARPKAMKKVRNLMSGAEIEIPVDTPRCCDPSSELYWTM